MAIASQASQFTSIASQNGRLRRAPRIIVFDRAFLRPRELDLEANPDAFGPKPYLDRIRIRFPGEDRSDGEREFEILTEAIADFDIRQEALGYIEIPPAFMRFLSSGHQGRLSGSRR